MSKFRKTTVIFGLLILVYAVYAALYIYRNSVVVDGQRYFVLFDDAMVSMRYARNLIHGNGLVWNPGERVEGFTNPLWVFFMAIIQLVPWPARLVGLPVQIAGALFFMGCLYFVFKIGEELRPASAVSLLAVGFTAFYGQLSTWNLLGMEVSLLLLMTSAAAWMALQSLRRGNFSPWLYVLLGVGTLVRMDMAVPFLAIWLFLCLFDAHRRKEHLLWGGGMLVAFLGGQTLLRFWYYGELLPNTYYLKVTGAPFFLTLKSGLFTFLKFVWSFNPALFVLPLAFALSRKEKSYWLLAGIFAAFCAYSVYVGGDSWEEKGGANRFIATGLPLFFVLLSCTLQDVWAWGKQSTSEISLHAETLLKFGAIALSYVGLVALSSLQDGEYLKFWLVLVGTIGVLGGLAWLELLFPKKATWFVTGGLVLSAISLVGVALYCRQVAAGDILPNAEAGISMTTALVNMAKVAAKFVVGLRAPLFLLPWVIGLAPRNRWTKIIAWLLLASGAGILLADGNAWTAISGPNRLVSAILPLFFVLLAWTWGGDGQPVIPRRPASVAASVGLLAFVAVSLVNFNALLSVDSLKYWLLLARHPFTPGSERYLRISHLVEQVSMPEATVAVVTAGIIPYYTGRYAIDLLGKADKHVAREPMHLTPGMPLVNFRPGHMKWDYTYSIRDLKPDVIAQVYSESPKEERREWVTDYYTLIRVGTITFYVRNDSPYIYWDEVEKLNEGQ